MKTSNIIRGLAGGLILGLVCVLVIVIVSRTSDAFFFLVMPNNPFQWLIWGIIGGTAGAGFGIFAKEKDNFSLYLMGGVVAYSSIMLACFLVYISPFSFPGAAEYPMIPADAVDFWSFFATSENMVSLIAGVIAGAGMAHRMVFGGREKREKPVALKWHTPFQLYKKV